jgi:hypothetical protein
VVVLLLLLLVLVDLVRCRLPVHQLRLHHRQLRLQARHLAHTVHPKSLLATQSGIHSEPEIWQDQKFA